MIDSYFNSLCSCHDNFCLQLRARIYFTLAKGNQDTFPHNDYPKGPYQYQTFFEIMRGDLNCPKSAHKMRPYLENLEYRYNISNDEVLYRSYLERNCSWMGARTEGICQRSLEVKSQVLANIIDKCYHEASLTGNVSLSKR